MQMQFSQLFVYVCVCVCAGSAFATRYYKVKYVETKDGRLKVCYENCQTKFNEN